MRKLFLSFAFLAAGLAWPAAASATDPQSARPGLKAGTYDSSRFLASARDYDSSRFLASARDAQTPQAPQQAAPQQAPAAQQATPPQATPQQPTPPPQATPPGVNPTSVCGQTIPAPKKLPPDNSSPVVYLIVPCFAKQGGSPVVEIGTYLFYIQLPSSQPSNDKWTPYDANAEKIIEDDFKRLWATTFLDDLSIEAIDYRFSNGVLGKIIVYDMEERERVKIVDYEGNKHVETTKIEDKLKEDNVRIGLDSFIDQGLITKVKNAILSLESEKGYEFATVTPKVTKIEGQGKTVHLTFVVSEGPKVKIREVAFTGNKAISSGALKRTMKNNKQSWIFSFITSRGTYQKDKYEEDAQKIVDYYRDRGYIGIRVGEPELKYLEDSYDRQTRWVQLRIPIAEGERYKVASFKFDGNKVVKTEFLQGLFKVQPGDWYSDKVIRKGLEKAQEAYGTVGYFEFTGYPELNPVGEDKPAEPNAAPPKTGQGTAADGAAADGERAAAQAGAAAPRAAAKPGQSGPPRVDVVMRMQEGKQYFVHRITFEGNTTTRDNVVRREMRLYEGGVFNTEALKYSVKRINQLGYFKQLEGGKDMQVEKTPGLDNQVDVTLKVQEQNRNQITFGAGVSQFEGFFGQLGFQTANFMGRGETFNVSLQAGSLAQLFQVGFTEPFLFDRNLTGGISLFKNRYDFINQFTQSSTGGNLTFGFPLGGGYSRMFLNYSYEHSKVDNVNQNLITPDIIANNPYLAEQLLISMSGSRVVSKITPSFVYNSIDNPIFPTAGRRFTASLDLAGIGGDTNFYKPFVEGVWYIPIGGSPSHQARTTLGLRAQAVYLSPFTGSSAQLPIFEKLVLGGEYSVRGFDLRSIGPKFPGSELVVGGNKSLLFNAEYIITIAGPVRLVLFADAGQVQDSGQKFSLPDFKTSTGAEVRFFMPVLNVPFRLIFAANPNRSGILDNSFLPQKAFSFRFAVGTTF